MENAREGERVSYQWSCRVCLPGRIKRSTRAKKRNQEQHEGIVSSRAAFPSRRSPFWWTGSSLPFVVKVTCRSKPFPPLCSTFIITPPESGCFAVLVFMCFFRALRHRQYASSPSRCLSLHV
ncbi:unnamed protein product [Ectocarpus sp. 12 AP-2014]